MPKDSLKAVSVSHELREVWGGIVHNFKLVTYNYL